MTLNTEAEFFCTMISWILDNPNNEYKWSKILHDKILLVNIIIKI